MKPKLSVAIIALNEQDKIAECLRSVRFADDLVVVDSGSRDQTADISRKHGARVFDHPFTNYSLQKNFAISQCEGDWVLSVDADERIPDALVAEINAVLQSNKNCNGYFIKRINKIFGRVIRFGDSLGGDYQLRLFKKDSGSFQGRIHERVVVQSATDRLKHPMIHESTSTVADYFHKLEKYATLEAEQMADAQRKATLVDMFLRPLICFIHRYFLLLGFLDGWAGLKYQFLSSYYVFVKFNKLNQLDRNQSQRSRNHGKLV